MSKWKIFTTQQFQKAETRFYEVLTKYLEGSKRSVKKAMYVQFRGVARNILNVTPPLYSGQGTGMMMGSRINWGQGRIAGQIRIRQSMENVITVLNENEERRLAKIREKKWNTLAKAMSKSGVSGTKPSTFSMLELEDREPLSWYLSIQPEHKRQRKIKPVDQLRINRSQFLALEKELFARQGYIPSGWKQMLKTFGLAIPAWVNRHNLAGSCQIIDTDIFYGFRATNNTNAKMSASVERRISVALNAQANKMERQLADWAKKKQKIP
jgi:hypothetical protein